MQVKFDTSSQDISLILGKSEFLNISRKRTKNFYENAKKATSIEAEAHFFLAHTTETLPSMNILDGGIELKLPEEPGIFHNQNIKSAGQKKKELII